MVQLPRNARKGEIENDDENDKGKSELTMATNEYSALTCYRNVFREMLRIRNPTRVENDSPDYARILISELLRSAQSEVWIYCDGLKPDVWDDSDVMRELDAAINRRVRFHVIVQDTPSADGTAAQRLRAANVPLQGTRQKIGQNFMVVDSRAYRFETDTAQRRGYASAYSPNNAAQLVQAFNDLAVERPVAASPSEKKAEAGADGSAVSDAYPPRGLSAAMRYVPH